ncbi:MAG: HAD family hydrolase [Thermodesulfobacteriota bacterium]
MFDLDGTLLDTLHDIADSANKALEKFGYKTLSYSRYEKLLGNGSRILITNAVPEEKRTIEHIEEVLESYLDIYENLETEKTRPYKGITDLLKSLTEKSIDLAVVTNKNDFLAQKCIKNFLSEFKFKFVLGQKEGFPTKPDPYMVHKAIEIMGGKAKNYIFLGDTPVDIETALNAGIKPVGVTWGFRSEKELVDAGAWKIINRPEDLINLLD